MIAEDVVSLRPAIKSDASAIGEVWFDSWMSTSPDEQSIQKSDLVIRAQEELSGRWDAIVVEIEGDIIGFLALVPDEQRLDQIFIKPAAQNRGIGKQLLDLAKKQFPKGFWLTVSTGNKRAVLFYQREGLTPAPQPEDTGTRIKYFYRP